MKYPFTWLCEYVPVEDSPARLAERLTFAGMEVEALDIHGGGLDDVRVAEILAVEPHPNADRLNVCRVYDGRAEYGVVCGADNFKAGDKAAFACDGCRLPGGMRIRKTRIRGVASQGMLCAEDELGLSDEHAGILIVPPDVLPGTPLSEVIGPPETVFTIEVTPNRGDCLSIIGMAREIAALYRLPLRWPAPEPVMAESNASELLKVEVSDPDICPRYTAHVIENCRTGDSPQWMRRRLTLCGVRPINNIVDITNYVMLECGQPLHAFDLERIQDSRLVVRRALEGEPLEMLDEVRRNLDSSMLVIADGKRAVAVAGVMGGESSGIDQNTTRIALESACFSPTSVRRTARSLGVSTEASYRFERGVDAARAKWAGRRAAALLTETTPAVCARGLIDIAQTAAIPKPVRMRTERVRSIMGCNVTDDEIRDILVALEFKVGPGDNHEERYVTPPSFRTDVSIEEDLVEEVARMHGLNNIPAPAPFARIVPEADDREFRELTRCRRTLAGMGLQEIVNYSFASHKFLDLFMPANREQRLEIPHPVSAEYAVMRPSLIPQMVETLGRNSSRQVAQAALFETGRVFWRDQDGGCREEDRLAIGLMGPMGRAPLDKQRPVEAQEIFLWLKGIVENLVRWQRIVPAGKGMLATGAALPSAPQYVCFEPGQALSIDIDGRHSGAMGIIDRKIAAQWRLNTPVAVLETSLQSLLPPMEQRPPQLKPAPAFPSVRRDLAIILSNEIRHQQVMEVIDEFAPRELTCVQPFDIFTGKGIGEGLKSLAYAFIYRAVDRTLTDEEVNRMHQIIREAVRERLRATIRE